MEQTTRRTLITGAGSGIGRATALRLARPGARVGLAGRREAPLVETAALCRARGALPLVHVCDVSDEEAVAGLAAAVAAAWDGALDALVNNAGVAHFARVTETDPRDWRRVLDVNLTGPFLVTRALLPALRRGDRPAIVMVASTLGLVGLRGAAAYCAAKAGLINFARALALEEAASGVRVNVVCPGVTATPMLDAGDPAADAARRARLARAHAAGRIGEADEIAAVIEPLAAAGPAFQTGAVVTADGGMTAGFLE